MRVRVSDSKKGSAVALAMLVGVCLPSPAEALFAGTGLRSDGEMATVVLEGGDGGTGVVFVVMMSDLIGVDVDCVEIVQKAPTGPPLLPAPRTAYVSGTSLTDRSEILIRIDDTGPASMSRDEIGIADASSVTPTSDRCGAGNVTTLPILIGDYGFIPE